MYKVDLPEDQSKEKTMERRRSAEAARKARIFNTRFRVMGLDLDALDQQVQEKKHRQNMEMQRNKAFAKLRELNDEALQQEENDEREKRAALTSKLTQYWATQQRVEDSRDADLKCGLKGAFEITIPEAELGPASMKIFQGEDIGWEQRRREQMKMTDRDLQAQKEENERRHMGDKHREMLMSKEQMLQNYRWVQQRALEEKHKKAACIELYNYNQALAAERAETLNEQHRREERDNIAEMFHTLTSDMMTESAEAAEREMGGGRPSRVAINSWRGMSPEQLSAIHREREEQCLQRQKQCDAEKIQDAVRKLQVLKLAREEEEEQRRAEELRRERRIQNVRDNMQLAREQQAHQEYLDKKVYTNRPSKDFFSQFNTSSR